MFESTHNALTFAYHFSSQQYSKSAMAQIGQIPTPSGKGLGGLDGAGQAGMIRAEVKRLGRIPEAILMCRYAPQTIVSSCTCPNCNGYHPNPEWRQAVFILAQEIESITNAQLDVRQAYILRHFTGRAIGFAELAKKFNKHENTFKTQFAKVKKWLIGQHVSIEIDGAMQKRFFPGVEKRALDDIEARLKEIGVVA